jgi:hypothetical protein
MQANLADGALDRRGRPSQSLREAAEARRDHGTRLRHELLGDERLGREHQRGHRRHLPDLLDHGGAVLAGVCRDPEARFGEHVVDDLDAAQIVALKPGVVESPLMTTRRTLPNVDGLTWSSASPARR